MFEPRPLIALALCLVTPLAAEEAKPVTAPSEIVAAAPRTDWVAIAPADLMVMELAPDARGKPRRVVIQLMPPPFSAGWVGNVRKLAAAHWWDGLSVNRVQDNYVVQWGDADGEDKAKARKLPDGLEKPGRDRIPKWLSARIVDVYAEGEGDTGPHMSITSFPFMTPNHPLPSISSDPVSGFFLSFPVMSEYGGLWRRTWPIHCYAMVGVGRNLPPDTGSGAELYAVIGHAPRHLDRNIAVVGRVIEGIEHLSSLPRGTGALGFYESAEERVPIKSIRLATELATNDIPRFEYLSTESQSFARYADARANRRDAFFVRPAGGADICNIPVPVRRTKQ